MADKSQTTIYERVEQLCDQWERNAHNLPPDARHVITRLAKQIVMDCAACCERRSNVEGKTYAISREACKCADQIRHTLLCKEGQHVCYYCDGVGCVYCCHTGIKTLPEAAQ